jgi:mannosyltransferase OCH1-like enzyme
MTAIPKLLHQTWKDTEIPEHYRPLAATWIENHPGWTYQLWTDEMNREFIREYHHDFLELYDSYEFNIQRVDAVRYFILYSYGGIFVDLDFECIKNVEPILAGRQSIFGLEPDAHCIFHQKQKIVCNAFMASVPGNLFFAEICKNLRTDKNIFSNTTPPWFKVLESTGPFKLTRLYDVSENQAAITLLDSDLLYPCTIDETRELLNDNPQISQSVQDRINKAYAIHYFLGSWWD